MHQYLEAWVGDGGVLSAVVLQVGYDAVALVRQAAVLHADTGQVTHALQGPLVRLGRWRTRRRGMTA